MAARLDTSSLRAWNANKPRRSDVAAAVSRIMAGVPAQWRGAMRHLGELRKDAPEWLACADALDTMRDFEQRHGNAISWAMGEPEICALADRLAGEAGELDAIMQG